MTLQELAELVSRMRRRQKDYFSTRSKLALEESRQLEAKVDKAVAEILRPGSLLEDQQ